MNRRGFITAAIGAAAAPIACEAEPAQHVWKTTVRYANFTSERREQMLAFIREANARLREQVRRARL